jgi:hypothetical protein
MGGPDIERDPDDASRTYWRVIGWGGALIVSLLVWTAVFWLVGQGADHQRRCEYGATTSASCPTMHQG